MRSRRVNESHVDGDHPELPSDSTNLDLNSCPSITAKKMGKEVMLLLPHPYTVPNGCVPTMPMLTIAGKKLTLVVLPPGAMMSLGSTDGAKVVYGSIEMKDSYGTTTTRGIATTAKDRASTHILSSDGNITAGDKGAVFVRVEALRGEFQGPYKTMSEVTTTNIFPHTSAVPADVRAMTFPFVKVETLDWASNGLWNDFEFYNLIGFHLYFNIDTMVELVHIQAWTLGIGETARFHNHAYQTFCEIHYCLSNGGGGGGMRYFPDNYTEPIDVNAELKKEYVEKNSTLIVVPSMYEHGPLWKVQPGYEAKPQLRKDDTVDYPWHAWLASKFGDYNLPIKPPLKADEQKYDLWMAFEFPPLAFKY